VGLIIIIKASFFEMQVYQMTLFKAQT